MLLEDWLKMTKYTDTSYGLVIDDTKVHVITKVDEFINELMPFVVPQILKDNIGDTHTVLYLLPPDTTSNINTFTKIEEALPSRAKGRFKINVAKLKTANINHKLRSFRKDVLNIYVSSMVNAINMQLSLDITDRDILTDVIAAYYIGINYPEYETTGIPNTIYSWKGDPVEHLGVDKEDVSSFITRTLPSLDVTTRLANLDKDVLGSMFNTLVPRDLHPFINDCQDLGTFIGLIYEINNNAFYKKSNLYRNITPFLKNGLDDIFKELDRQYL